jgi:hypothetical protein
MSIVLDGPNLQSVLKEAMGMKGIQYVPTGKFTAWKYSDNELLQDWYFQFQDGDKITLKAKHQTDGELMIVCSRNELRSWRIIAPAGSDVHCWMDENHPKAYQVGRDDVAAFCNQYQDGDVPEDMASMIVFLWFTALTSN